MIETPYTTTPVLAAVLFGPGWAVLTWSDGSRMEMVATLGEALAKVREIQSAEAANRYRRLIGN